MGGSGRIIWFIVLGVALAALPLVMRDGYLLGLAVLVGVNTIIVLGLNLLMGYAGQVSLGQAAFVGIGAYATAILSARLGWSPWLGLTAATGLGGLIAGLVGIPLLRLRGHYLAMGTLGFGIIVHIVIVQWESLTASTIGITSIPPLALWRLALDEPIRMYYLVAAVVLICVVMANNIVDSRVGRAMRAVHGSEVAASTSGVDVQRYKRQVFVLSGALAGLAGGLFAHYQGYISPESFELGYSISLVVMAVIGGMASIWGAIFGAAAVTLLNESLRGLLDYREIGFGLLLMLLVIFGPIGRWKIVRREGDIPRRGEDIRLLPRRCGRCGAQSPPEAIVCSVCHTSFRPTGLGVLCMLGLIGSVLSVVVGILVLLQGMNRVADNVHGAGGGFLGVVGIALGVWAFGIYNGLRRGSPAAWHRVRLLWIVYLVFLALPTALVLPLGGSADAWRAVGALAAHLLPGAGVIAILWWYLGRPAVKKFCHVAECAERPGHAEGMPVGGRPAEMTQAGAGEEPSE